MPSTSAADFTFFAAAPAASDADAVYVVGNHLGALCGPLSAAGNFLRRRALLFDCRGNRGGNSVHLADDSANSLDRLDSLQGNFLNRRDLSRISSVAFAVWLASDLTSDATTANPLPACPARAASMVAFNASRFVCEAMSLIRPTTSPIRLAVVESPWTVSSVCRALSTARLAIFASVCNLPADVVDRCAQLLRGGGNALHVRRGVSRSFRRQMNLLVGLI
jgi:hypothetical protein